MEAYENEQPRESKLYNVYAKSRSWVSTFMGVLLTVLGVGLIFVVSTLEGTKEIKASRGDCAEILEIWRNENGTGAGTYPEEKVDIVEYQGKDYYFIIAERDIETDAITDWYFAYDGGLEYVFGDWKFYALTSMTIAVSIYVSNINYMTSVRSMMETETFKKTLLNYQQKKSDVEAFSQYIPDFCIYKNEQAYNIAKRNIIEEAGISWEYYNSKEFDPNKLEKWQRKVLTKIKKIKIERIHSNDLLQEHGQVTSKIVILPMSQQVHQRRFLIHGSISKIITSALSGLVVAFGVVFGNWVLGIAYGFSVLLSYFSSVIIASDFVMSTLRNRFISKGDLLVEFKNIKDRFSTPKVTEKSPIVVSAPAQVAIQPIEKVEQINSTPSPTPILVPIK